MSSFIGHSTTSLLVATLATPKPLSTAEILIIILLQALLDLDHLPFLFKKLLKERDYKFKPNELAGARSPMHELFGVMVIMAVALYLALSGYLRESQIYGLALVTHIAQDMILGLSSPYLPFFKDTMMLYSLSKKTKVIIDLLIISIGGSLFLLLN